MGFQNSRRRKKILLLAQERTATCSLPACLTSRTEKVYLLFQVLLSANKTLVDFNKLLCPWGEPALPKLYKEISCNYLNILDPLKEEHSRKTTNSREDHDTRRAKNKRTNWSRKKRTIYECTGNSARQNSNSSLSSENQLLLNGRKGHERTDSKENDL